MSTFKCKMCGGTLEIQNGSTVAECEYCGAKQTLPKLDDEKRANLYDRANHFRRSNEFDKATAIYEQILNEDGTDAEAYWSLVLCHYGIEYVEDPLSHRRVPTVHRAQFTSIFDDDNYKLALENADSYQRIIYEEEAKAINEIQKGILAISQKEDPFDVFICYKETDSNGERTRDSVLANDLYYQLKQEGFKVFFARITLEDKLGSAYEPYIFAALNSAKVMVVIGTKPEYFNAVWVRNEWSRFLSLIKRGEKKMLIPAYRDMDPYDLPREFSHLQAQDMSKLGFMQDLVRGIKKITGVNEPQTAATARSYASLERESSVNPLLTRAFLFIEDGDWSSAEEYCEKVLDQAPELGEAYLAKLMIQLHVKTRDELMVREEPFDNSGYYQKAYRYGDHKLRAFLKECNQRIVDRNERKRAEYEQMIAEETQRKIEEEQERLEDIYSRAVEKMSIASDSSAYNEVRSLLSPIRYYKDSEALIARCLELNDKEKKYSRAVNLMNSARRTSDYERAVAIFDSIVDYKNASELAQLCRENVAGEQQRIKYDRAVRIMKKAQTPAEYEKAAKEFSEMGEFLDSPHLSFQCVQTAIALGTETKKCRKHNLKLLIITIIIFVVLSLAFTVFEGLACYAQDPSSGIVGTIFLASFMLSLGVFALNFGCVSNLVTLIAILINAFNPLKIGRTWKKIATVMSIIWLSLSAMFLMFMLYGSIVDGVDASDATMLICIAYGTVLDVAYLISSFGIKSPKKYK